MLVDHIRFFREVLSYSVLLMRQVTSNHFPGTGFRDESSSLYIGYIDNFFWFIRLTNGTLLLYSNGTINRYSLSDLSCCRGIMP